MHKATCIRAQADMHIEKQQTLTCALRRYSAHLHIHALAIPAPTQTCTCKHTHAPLVYSFAAQLNPLSHHLLCMSKERHGLIIVLLGREGRHVLSLSDT